MGGGTRGFTVSRDLAFLSEVVFLMGKNIFQVLSVRLKLNSCNMDYVLGTDLYLSIILFPPPPPRGKIKRKGIKEGLDFPAIFLI